MLSHQTVSSLLGDKLTQTTVQYNSRPLYESDAFEFDNISSFAKEITPNGGVQTRTFHSSNDQDWVKFTALPGVTYIFETRGNIDTQLRFFNRDSETSQIFIDVNNDGGAGKNERKIIRVESPGSYPIRINSVENVIGEYSINLRSFGTPTAFLPDSSEPDDTRNDANIIATNGQQARHTLHTEDDVDWIFFNSRSGATYTIETQGELDLQLICFDPSGRETDYDRDEGSENNERKVVRAGRSGRYYVRISRASGPLSLFRKSRGPYQISVQASQSGPGNPYYASTVTPAFTLPIYKENQVRLSSGSARGVLQFFFDGTRCVSLPNQLTWEDRAFAQALLFTAVRQTYQIGIIEFLVRIYAFNPPRTWLSLGSRVTFAIAAMRDLLLNVATGKQLDNPIIYETVRTVLAPNACLVFGLRPQQSAKLLSNTPPDDSKLEQNYPNPFNSQTHIKYELNQSSEISIVIFDVLGQRIATLFQGTQSAGLHEVYWTGTNDLGRKVSSGVYFIQLQTPTQQFSRRMLLVE